jgi:type IV secretory pathway VirB4 component
LPIIKDLGPGRYLPENDFQLSDLSEKQIEELIKFNPEMKMIYYKNKLIAKESSNRTQDIIQKDMPIDVLIELSGDKDHEIRQAVAMNKNTPVETIVKLNNDKSAEVQRGVCLNPNTPTEILLNHSEFSEITIAIMLASNSSLPQKGLFNIFNRFIDGVNYAKMKEVPTSILIRRLRMRNDLPKEIEEKLNLISNKE